jgi:hypothetical protein
MNHIFLNSRMFGIKRFIHVRKRALHAIHTLIHPIPWEVADKPRRGRSRGRQPPRDSAGSRCRLTSCSIQTVHRRLNFRHVRLDLLDICFHGCKGCFRHPMVVQMSCEHWRDSRVLLKSNLQELLHFPVGLKDLPPGSYNSLMLVELQQSHAVEPF